MACREISLQIMGANLNGKMIQQLFQQFQIEHRNLVPYCPQMNGVVEAANNNIKKILVKTPNTYKDWHEYLPLPLYAYRTFVRTSTGVTSYSLVYGMEVVHPMEVEILSLRILSMIELSKAKWARSQYKQELDG